jgi:radical SAM superfamily enzyme
VRHLKKIGMTVHGTFTYGLPGETPEQMQDTKRYIASLPFDSVQESGTAEIEGTPLATLRRTGALKAYANAKMDENYDRQVDGNKKYQQLARALQEA